MIAKGVKKGIYHCKVNSFLTLMSWLAWLLFKMVTVNALNEVIA
jgi:hypothetical protein